MPQIINTNIASLNAQRNLNTSQSALGVALQRLSSGLRINSAKDDAAGLAISERFTTQIRGLSQAARNANDAISLAQTAEGALGESGNLLQRIRELSIQAANATNSGTDRQALNSEVNQLLAELQRIADTSTFNGQKLLDGTFQNQQFQVGAQANETITFGVGNAQTDALGSFTFNNTATAVTGAALVAGDLTINGVDVGASTSASAEDKVNAINSVASGTGVNATATTTLSPSANPLRRGQALSSGDLVINGVDIGTVAGSNNIATQGAGVASKINQFTNSTGVTASANTVTGAITLTSNTGKDIALTTNNGDAGGSRVENATGIEVSASTATAQSTFTFTGTKGAYTLTATGDGTGSTGETLTVGGNTLTVVTIASGTGNTATTVEEGASTAGFAANIRTALGLAVTANGLDATVSGAGNDAIVTSTLHSVTDTDAVVTEAVTEATVATTGTAAGIAVADTLVLDGVTYTFNTDGSGGNTFIGLNVADNNALAAAFVASLTAENTSLNTGITAVAPANVATVTADLRGTPGNATVDGNLVGITAGVVENLAGGTGTAADLAFTASTTRGIISLTSGTQFSIGGTNAAKAGLATASVSLTAINTIDITTVAGANTAISLVDGALAQVSTIRADLGAIQNRVESTIANLTTSVENFSAARSRILDADFAAETAALTRAQILQQAGVAILAQANALPQTALALLQ